MKIKKNPFADHLRGYTVWVRYRNETFPTEFYDTDGMKVTVWDPIGVTKDIFITVDAENVFFRDPDKQVVIRG